MDKEIMDLSTLYSQYFTNSFIDLYTYAVLLLLMFGLINNKVGQEAKNGLYVFNTVMGWVSVLNLLFFAQLFFIAWYGQNPYELHAFSNYIFGSHINPYKLILCINLYGMFFLFKKFRLRTWFVIIFLIILNIGGLFRLLSQFNRDYLPSWWSDNYSPTFLQLLSKWIAAPLVLVFTYWILHKRNKLPHPSLFFKKDVQPG